MIRKSRKVFKFFLRVAIILYNSTTNKYEDIFYNQWKIKNHEPVNEFINVYCQDLRFFFWSFQGNLRYQHKKSWKKIEQRIVSSYSFCLYENHAFSEWTVFVTSIVTEKFFTNMINIMDRKIHLHHSHLTGQIYGYLHSFSNSKVRENKYFLRLFAQNLLELDLFFAVKGIKLCVSRTKNLSISGSNLTNINYTNISDQVKFTDIMKYYQ